MILRVLLLISFTCCVCGTFVVNVTQSFYQAEENHNITLEWSFTSTADTSPETVLIYCEMLTDQKAKIVYHLHGIPNLPESQDKEFAGRVQCDKDVIREGRVRLHMSRLRIEDSGLYLCEVTTTYGQDEDKCLLNVTAARDQPEPERPNMTRDQPEPERPNTAGDQPEPERPNSARDQPEPERPNTAGDQPEPERPNTAGDQPEPEKRNSASRGRNALYWSLGATAAVVLLFVAF